MFNYRCLLAFGSNLGDRIFNFERALYELEPFVQIRQQTCWHETMPLTHPVHDTSHHKNYLNFVCDVQSNVNPMELYSSVIVKIEDKIGHSRAQKWQPRHLDIDILFAAKNDAQNFENCSPWVINRNGFSVPHQSYFEREFWRQMVEKELFVTPEKLHSHFMILKQQIEHMCSRKEFRT